jgi:hypothetical protein
MPETPPPSPPTSPPAAAPGPPTSPIVRLKTWVNVVLVLSLLASCSAASNLSDLANQTGGDVVTQTSDGSQVASQDEVADLCRLLGAVAAKQDIDLDAVFQGSSAATQCQDAARDTSTP